MSRLLLATLLIFVVGSAVAQQLLPLPRATAELLSNTSFDIDSDGDKLPDGWSGKNTTAVKADKIKCDKPGKLVAHSGTCAFMFRGNPDASLSKIQQKVTDTSTITDGAEITFSVYVDTRSGVPGVTIGQAKVKYSDSTATKFTLALPAAGLRDVADYQQLSNTQTIDIAEGTTITKVKVDFRYQGSSGKFLIDDASFAIITADPTATPTDTLQSSITPTDENATSTQTEEPTLTTTFTSTPSITPTQPEVTFTPTDEPSVTPSPTATFTATDTATSTATPTETHTPTATPIPSPFQLITGDGSANDYFGYAVAISGDTIVVGAFFDDIGANTNQGSVYVFTRSGATWTLQQKLTASDGGAFEYFGSSVVISVDTLVVGAYRDAIGANSDQGSAYVFTRIGTTWTEQQKLTASDGEAGDNFGVSVAISGETVVVGSSFDDIGANADQGSAYVFTRSGTIWTQQQRLTADDGASADQFGYSVAVSGDTIAVGAFFDDIGATNNQGSAYVFIHNATWIQQQTLTASDGTGEDLFGTSVAISGDTIAVGAYFHNVAANNDQGAAYVFTRSGSVWTQQQKLIASDGAASDGFGITVGLSGDTVVVGANFDNIAANNDQGSAYVFTRSGTTWTEQQKLTAIDGAAFDYFGYAVAYSNNTVVVGAFFDDIGANGDQGSAWVFGLP